MATKDDDGAWFAPKRYGYGAGPPIAWRGWALLGGYIALIAVVGSLLPHHPALVLAIIVPATIALIVVSAQHTRGGWRWRWGE